MKNERVTFTARNKMGLDAHKIFIMGLNSSILLNNSPKCVAMPSKIFKVAMNKLRKMLLRLSIIAPPLHLVNELRIIYP